MIPHMVINTSFYLSIKAGQIRQIRQVRVAPQVLQRIHLRIYQNKIQKINNIFNIYLRNMIVFVSYISLL